MTSVDAKGGRRPNACQRRDVARKLVYWDGLEQSDLAELEAHAFDCPVCGPRLSVLKRSQRILDASGAAPETCPSSEELYDFGRGPGHGVLPGERLVTIRQHVVACSECQALLETLESRPPLPLDVRPEQPDEPFQPARTQRRRPWLVPLATAAGLVAAVALWQVVRGPAVPGRAGPAVATAPTGYLYPESIAMRGQLEGPLFYPRGPVLEAREGGLLHDLEFEIEPQEGATEYRVLLYRQTEDVFVPGEQISVLRNTSSKILPPRP